jgi:hypothetical protein
MDKKAGAATQPDQAGRSRLLYFRLVSGVSFTLAASSPARFS